MRFWVRPLASLSGWGSGIAMSCGVGHRRGLDLTLLWFWCRLAATAPIQPLAWEPPYTAGAALKRQKKRKERKSSGCLWCSVPFLPKCTLWDIPWWCSRLRIWHCHSCGTGCSSGVGSIPGLGTAACRACSQKQQQNVLCGSCVLREAFQESILPSGEFGKSAFPKSWQSNAL